MAGVGGAGPGEGELLEVGGEGGGGGEDVVEAVGFGITGCDGEAMVGDEGSEGAAVEEAERFFGVAIGPGRAGGGDEIGGEALGGDFHAEDETRGRGGFGASGEGGGKPPRRGQCTERRGARGRGRIGPDP